MELIHSILEAIINSTAPSTWFLVISLFASYRYFRKTR